MHLLNTSMSDKLGWNRILVAMGPTRTISYSPWTGWFGVFEPRVYISVLQPVQCNVHTEVLVCGSQDGIIEAVCTNLVRCCLFCP